MPRSNELLSPTAKRVALHALFWTGVYCFNIFENWAGTADKKALFEIFTTKLPVQMAVAYLLVYRQLPLIFKKEYRRFFISVFLSVYLVCSMYATYRAYYFDLAYPEYFKAQIEQSLLTYIDFMTYLMFASTLYYPAMIMTGIKLIRTHYQEQQKHESLEKEKLQTELSFLKNQLNPHFLFNTLNNLYMLTLKASPQAPEVVSRLSETLDYMLYRCHEKVVTLTGEIQLIENYLLLEKLRLNDDVKVEFRHEGELSGVFIAPLIMLSLIENAFKHGVHKGAGGARVMISIAADHGSVRFTSVNTCHANAVENQAGIGLKNVRRQLELIYPGKHILHLQKTHDQYTVNLQLHTSR